VQEVSGYRVKYWSMDVVREAPGTLTFKPTGADMGFCLYWSDAALNPTVEDMSSWARWAGVCG
jgi:hypothetical protein